MSGKLQELVSLHFEGFMKHCKQEFRPFDVWYLFDNKGFYDRSLKLGKCPVCKKAIAELKETRKEDDRIFTQVEIGSEAERLADINRGSVNYSSLEIKLKAYKMTMPKSIRYGENKIITKGGKQYVRQNAVSWLNGKKEVVKDLPIKSLSGKDADVRGN